MGRRNKGFQWTADEDDPERLEPVEREPRSVLKDHLAEVDDLVRDILARSATERAHLGLDAALLHELQVLDELPPGPAVKRQLGYVKRLVAALDVEALREAVEGDTPHDLWLRRIERWRQRLLTGGDDALQDLLEENPRADRQRLRTLIRQAHDDEGGARKLFDALKEELPE